MKVKVVKTPKIKPLYQQDKKTFALDTTTLSYPYDNSKEDPRIGTQYPEVSEDQANIEAEKGETILTPEMEHYTIGGKTHKQGGTPIKADVGSFIFSNDKKLKIKGSILEEFGIKSTSEKAKDGMTPADVAKQYKTNRFLAVLRDPEASKIDKDTASIMMGTLKNKLSKLAFLQEAKKGFPDGVPSLAKSEELIEDEQATGFEFKKGGLIKAQWGAAKIPGLIKKGQEYGFAKPPRNRKPGEWSQDPNTGRWFKNPTPSVEPEPVVPITRGRRRGRGTKPSTVGDVTSDSPAPDSLWKLKPGFDYKWKIPGDTSNATPPGTNQETGKRDVTAPQTFEQSYFDTGYGTVDYINMSAPWMVPIKKFPPIRTHIQPQRVEFNPMDLEAQRQAIRGQAARAYEANDILSSSSGMASARNSQILGQVLDPLNQSFMTEFNTNQAGRMQIDAQNAGFRGQADVVNAQEDVRYNTANAITNENFLTEKRARLQQFLKGLSVAEKSRQFRNAANVINRDFSIGANGQIRRRILPQEQAEARVMGDSMSSNGREISFDQFKQSLPPDVLSGATDQWLYDKWQQSNSAMYRGRDAQNVSVTSRNPYLIPQPYDYSTLPQ